MIDLSQFDPHGFQDLAAALAIAEYDATVRSMGSGTDGGRDLMHEGELDVSSGGVSKSVKLSGFTVFQVKHMERPGSHQANASWLWGEIRKELNTWSTSAKRKTMPDHLIFVTNIALTPAPDAGGFDEVRRSIASYIRRANEESKEGSDEEERAINIERARRLNSIKSFHFWDLHQITALVNAHSSVRWRFNAFLTPGDILSCLPTILPGVTAPQLEGALRAHARTALMSGGLIYFDEAGGNADAGVHVHKVAIDLPVVLPDSRRSGGARSTALKYLLERSGRVLRPMATTVQKPHHIIVAGAPGNGKTTLSKLLVQAHRAAFLRDSIALSDEQSALIEATDEALIGLGVALPRYRRWPIQINLAEYAQEGGMEFGATLIRRMADEISRKSDVGDVTPAVLTSWRTRWPWLVVLDGLDEVVDPTIRRRIIEQVTEFANDCEAVKADVLIILTTRPMGFDERIAPTLFERIDLADLAVEAAVRYGERVTEVRNPNDPDRRDAIIARVRSAANDDALVNLLRTPLQVLILTIIVEQARELSPDRFGLFDGYFRTVMSREISKPGGFSGLIRDHSTLIEEIHQHVGIELQARAEHSETTLSVISRQDLRDIAWKALLREGFAPDGRDKRLLEDLLNAATRRLVLLAPHGDDGYGFDVRSLQELMAGLYITAETEERVRQRLILTAVSPHWRNTWMFAAGKMFAQPVRPLQESIVTIVESIDDGAHHRLSAIAPIGPRLALDIIDDGMARSRPIWLERLTRVAFRVLDETSPPDLRALTQAFVRLAMSGDSAQAWVADGLRNYLAQSYAARRVATVMKSLWFDVCAELSAPVNVRGISQVLGNLKAAAQPPQEPDVRLTLSREEDALLSFALDEIGKALATASKTNDVPRKVIEALGTPNVALALEMALARRVVSKPELFRWLVAEVLSTVNRMPVGQKLLPVD